jgi:hypothetical protein
MQVHQPLISRFTTLVEVHRCNFKNGKLFLLSVCCMNFSSQTIIYFITHTGIEAGLALIADALLNDLVGQLPVLSTSDDGNPNMLREGVMKTVQTFGSPEEILVANETKEIQLR